jgi:hypothetical protein
MQHAMKLEAMYVGIAAWALTGSAGDRIFPRFGSARRSVNGKGIACIDIVSHGRQTTLICGNLLIATLELT